MWKVWEAIGSDVRPRYKWRHSWREKAGDDFVGFDGEKQIGRIFQINEPWTKERWFWIVQTEGGEKLNWPVAGYEQSAAYAACRVEMVYGHIKRSERRAVME